MPSLGRAYADRAHEVTDADDLPSPSTRCGERVASTYTTVVQGNPWMHTRLEVRAAGSFGKRVL